MEKLILFLNTSDIPACQTPVVLQIIYFGKLLINIVHVIIPIGLIIFMLIDFSKCVINGDDTEQKKIGKICFKRILYACFIYCIPYVISLLMTIISDFVPDYNLCITNATPENIEVFTAKYEEALEKEKQNRIEQMNYYQANKFNISYNKGEFYTNFNNLNQYSGQPWTKYPIACATNRNDATIRSSGCGYVAYTMVVRSFGYLDVTPEQIVDIACNEAGHKNSAASAPLLTGKILNDKFGLKGGWIKKKDAEQALLDGKKLIILMPGHWISVLGINPDGTVLVGDSGLGFEGNNQYTIDTLYEATANYREPYGWHAVLAYSKK